MSSLILTPTHHINVRIHSLSHQKKFNSKQIQFAIPIETHNTYTFLLERMHKSPINRLRDPTNFANTSARCMYRFLRYEDIRSSSEPRTCVCNFKERICIPSRCNFVFEYSRRELTLSRNVKAQIIGSVLSCLFFNVDALFRLTFNLQKQNSSEQQIHLTNLDLSASGTYTCEVSMETPIFSKESDPKTLTVIGKRTRILQHQQNKLVKKTRKKRESRYKHVQKKIERETSRFPFFLSVCTQSRG